MVNSSDWENYEVAMRAKTRHNRRRTKERPVYDMAVLGKIITISRGRYQVFLEDDISGEVFVTAIRGRHLSKSAVIVGDVVRLVGDCSGVEGSLARIVAVEERSNTLRRSIEDNDLFERNIVANVDQLVIVVAAANPTPRVRLIDRAIVVALDANILPILFITKTDLASADYLVKYYEGFSFPTILSKFDSGANLDGVAVEALKKMLPDKVSVLLGHSGVGKSTLMNAVAGSGRAVGSVNSVTGRGKHTSSSLLAERVYSGFGDVGWIIDTPGIRSLGLGHVSSHSILAAFPDLRPGVDGCPRRCAHLKDSGECNLDSWIASQGVGALIFDRLDSYRRLLGSKED